LIKIPPGAIELGESSKEMGKAALGACQVTLPEGWTIERFGDEIIDAIFPIPGYVEQARKPRVEVIGGALIELQKAAEKLAEAVTVTFDDRPTRHSAAAAMQRKIQDRIRQQLLGIQIHEGALLNFRQETTLGADGETIYHNNPAHDFLRDLEPRIQLVKRAIESNYELTAAVMERPGSRRKQTPTSTRNRTRSVGARVVAALLVDLLDKWKAIFGNYPKVTPLWQGRQDGKLSAGKQFPALVRFVCQRGGIEFQTDNALHLEIVRAVRAHRSRGGGSDR
jgi:hypothetical protein